MCVVYDYIYNIYVLYIFKIMLQKLILEICFLTLSIFFINVWCHLILNCFQWTVTMEGRADIISARQALAHQAFPMCTHLQNDLQELVQLSTHTPLFPPMLTVRCAGERKNGPKNGPSARCHKKKKTTPETGSKNRK